MSYYDSPAIRVREGLRRWVREILICVVVVGLPATFFVSSYQAGTLGVLFAFVMFGVPGGAVLWLIYRILRFALGR